MSNIWPIRLVPNLVDIFVFTKPEAVCDVPGAPTLYPTHVPTTIPSLIPTALPSGRFRFYIVSL